MPESGQMQSSQSSVVTHPIDNHPSNTYIPRPGKTQEVAREEFPEAIDLDEHKLFHKEPYSFTYFGIPKDLKQIENYQKAAQKIDEFITSEITSKQLSHSFETYKHIVTELLGSLKLHRDTDAAVVMSKLAKWITEVVFPQKELERRKQEILHD